MSRGSTPYNRKASGTPVVRMPGLTIDADVLEQVRLLLKDPFTKRTAYAGFSTLIDNLLRTWIRHRREHDPAAAAKLDEWDRAKQSAVIASKGDKVEMEKYDA